MESHILEVSAILNDFRVDSIGGLRAGLEIFELAIIPSLLNNADTWTKIDFETENKLEKLQNLMFRNLFAVPVSTPKHMLRFELGNLNMKEKVHMKKLFFLHHLKYLDKTSLGGEFFDMQARFRFPGLINECRGLIKMYKKPDIIDHGHDFSKQAWKKIVKESILKKSESIIKEEIRKYSKLKDIDLNQEGLQLKEYIKNMTLRSTRTMFRIRSHMLDLKMNRKSDQKYSDEMWKCDFCLSLDTQSHIIWCPAFASLREGKNLQNDMDLVTYFTAVMKIRENQKT